MTEDIKLTPLKFQESKAPLTLSVTAVAKEYTGTQQYYALLNTPATSKIPSIVKDKNTVIDKLSNTLVTNKGDLRFTIAGTDKPLRTSTSKLLDMLVLTLTNQNNYASKDDSKYNREIHISLKKYVELLGKDPSKKATVDKERRKVKEDLEILKSSSIRWSGKGKDQKEDFLDVNIAEAVGFSRGTIIFKFTDTMAKHLINNGYIMQYPISFMTIDERNANTYPIARKMKDHFSNDINARRGTNDILSVKTLLDNAPDIPTIEEVNSGNRLWRDRIQYPLEKSLDAVPMLKNGWQYCNPKKEPLNKDQMDIPDYATFIKLYINFEFEGEPDQTQRRQRKEAKRAKAIQRKEASKVKKFKRNTVRE